MRTPPRTVLNEWGLKEGLLIRRVPMGILHETYEIKSGEEIFFLQKLHRLVSSTGPTDNYKMITDFLRANGSPAQEVVCAAGGKLLTAHDSGQWRLLRGVHGRVYGVAPSNFAVREAGRCLGKIHQLLAAFRGSLRPTLPMFQYSKVFQKLRGYRKKFSCDKNWAVREAAVFLSENFPRFFLPVGLPKQLIHTDPKVSNFVFDERTRAVAMIDWDTAQKLSPLYDIGDAIRSFCGRAEDAKNNQFNTEKYKAFLSGYVLGSGNHLSSREKRLIFRAAGLIILGLASRFLNDYIDNSYFGWDRGKYSSRKSHNIARALGQIALFKSFMFLPQEYPHR